MVAHGGDDRWNSLRRAATLRLAFQYAGKRHVGITTDVTGHEATLVAAVHLPAGAMLVCDVLEGRADAPSADGIRLIASVAWSGPAPFGSSDAWAASLHLVRASGPSYERLEAFAHAALGIEDASDILRRDDARPSLDLRESARPAPRSERSHPDAEARRRVAVLYQSEGTCLRGELVSARPGVVWVATESTPPRIRAPVRIHVGVKRGNERLPLVIEGLVPDSPIPDNRTRGWVFECEVRHVSHRELFAGVMEFLGMGTTHR